MKALTRYFLVIVAVLMIAIGLNTENVSAQTCLHSGCNRKCYSGDRYCYKHKTYSTNKKNNKTTTKKTYNKDNSKKKTGSTNSSRRKKMTKKSYYTDDMPDCDDYDNWGEFMDDWDGNMPDGSDASDYWDNW